MKQSFDGTKEDLHPEEPALFETPPLRRLLRMRAGVSKDAGRKTGSGDAFVCS